GELPERVLRRAERGLELADESAGRAVELDDGSGALADDVEVAIGAEGEAGGALEAACARGDEVGDGVGIDVDADDAVAAKIGGVEFAIGPEDDVARVGDLPGGDVADGHAAGAMVFADRAGRLRDEDVELAADIEPVAHAVQ